MKKIFEFSYKVYSGDNTYYSKHEISAISVREAYVKFVAESNGLAQTVAKEKIEMKLGKVWLVEDAIEEFNPLGSCDLDLYKVVSVKKQVTKCSPYSII